MTSPFSSGPVTSDRPDSAAAATPPAPPEARDSIRTLAGLSALLARLRSTLLISTYQAGKLAVVSAPEAGLISRFTISSA